MAPQESNLRNKNLSFYELPILKKRRNRGKKKKSNFPLQNNPEVIQNSVKNDEIVTITSTSSDSSPVLTNVSDKDDDVIIINKPTEEIFLTDSEAENELDKLEDDVIILDECNSDNETSNTNIVINVNQLSSTLIDVKNSSSNEMSPRRKRPCETEVINSEEIKRSKTLRQEFPKAWTKDMIKYYTEPCDKSRNFNYIEILDNLNSNPHDWWINQDDMIGIRKNKSPKVRCHKCGLVGHMVKECKKHTVCFMCGQFNHFFKNCPNKICLNCGRPSKEFLMNCHHCRNVMRNQKPCELCGQLYHERFICPSQWRKYLVLDPSNISVVKQNPRKYCYNCASKGHFGFECPQDSDYPSDNPLISSFINHQNHNENIVIFLTKETAELLRTGDGSIFLKYFSELMNTRIELIHGLRDYIKLFGDNELINNFKNEFVKWRLTLLKLPNLIRL